MLIKVDNLDTSEIVEAVMSILAWVILGVSAGVMPNGRLRLR
ncbi:hypothetical protein [Nostoc flagelliforme]